MDTDPPASRMQSEGASHQPLADATATPAAADDAASHRVTITQTETGSQSGSASVDASPNDSSADASVAASSSGSAKSFQAGLDRQIYVFTREAVAAAEASNRYVCLALRAIIAWYRTLVNFACDSFYQQGRAKGCLGGVKLGAEPVVI